VLCKFIHTTTHPHNVTTVQQHGAAIALVPCPQQHASYPCCCSLHALPQDYHPPPTVGVWGPGTQCTADTPQHMLFAVCSCIAGNTAHVCWCKGVPILCALTVLTTSHHQKSTVHWQMQLADRHLRCTAMPVFIQAHLLSAALYPAVLLQVPKRSCTHVPFGFSCQVKKSLNSPGGTHPVTLVLDRS
jgi:hypothetical protein